MTVTKLSDSLWRVALKERPDRPLMLTACPSEETLGKLRGPLYWLVREDKCWASR